MRAYVFGVAGIVALAAEADAQIVGNRLPVESPPTEYVVPPPIPPGGCVWENAVFSNGAILERYIGRTFYFRCMNGQWRSFYSFYEATLGSDEPSSPKRSPERKPAPPR